ncbi:MAG: rhodanese-like domain-containing protein [Chitinophagaceae bacterium]|nr:rhodanese-like domain-containing protein [Chitinophagaceae bacterium]MDP1763880.1 rhodanese-like domain-containing protein [Sediminibacterium sp.]MDP1811628.1 rhodanese-like domain-containing protein [Sediminibacterium sp.]MDP3127386.1 rhodanese-like domain-containing protein [Sediminibacterium sp.]MDP3665249.1 rhodanese-like domain-containing protein [Sediminibacterium sp.]
MKAVRFLSFLILLTATIISCSNSSANTDNTNHTILPKPGKTIIVDVHTVEEWNNDGHADCTVNYPLDELSTKIETLKAYEKVIVVCCSGNRANAAKEMLEQSGIKDVENKGAWQDIACK